MDQPMEYVSRDQYDGRKEVVDERFKRDKERLTAHEESIAEMQRLTSEIAALNKNHEEQLKKHEQRICTLERQPADQYGKIKTALVTALVSGAVGYVISAITNG
jgi:chromosome segregation ATPase